MDALKQAAALAAVERIGSNKIIGLGSGSTMEFVVREIGERVRAGKMDIAGVATSMQTRLLAREYNIPLREMMDVERIDLAIDGADEFDPAGNLIKGGGGCHTIEKLVASLADRFIVVVHEAKRVAHLGETFAVPIEALAPGISLVMRRIRELGGEPRIRTGAGKAGPVISDLGNIILDAEFGPIADPAELDRSLKRITGLVEHGLFVGMASQIIVAKGDAKNPAIEIIDL